MTQPKPDTDTEATQLARLHDLPTTYGEVAPILVANGWAPVSLDPGTKKPNRREWQHRTELLPIDRRRLVEQELQWRGPTDRRGCAAGLVMPSTVLAIDSDSLDRLVQDAVWQLMLDTLGRPDMVRIGRAPKFMVFYAATPGIRSSKLPGLEFFCGSGQIAAFGIHEVTRQPYAWSDRNPLNTQAHQLCTHVSPQMVEHFIARVVSAGVLPAARPRGDFTTVVGKYPRHQPVFEATMRLDALFDKYDGLVRPAIRELVQQIGTEGRGRHNAIIAIAGRIVLQKWTDKQALEFLTPLINENFADGDWTAEIEAALCHARGREAARSTGMKTASWPSARVGAVR